jgi:serine/threonine protein kinase
MNAWNEQSQLRPFARPTKAAMLGSACGAKRDRFARVNHPRVCQVFDVLEDGDALVLLLELLEGQSLADRLARRTISTSDAVGIERQILEALHRGRHLDPHLVTSAEHTYFLLGDYSKTLDCYAKKSGY